MSVIYFAPGGNTADLGTLNDPWNRVIANDAAIESFKNKGNENAPVYFDEQGKPQQVKAISVDTAAGLSIVNGQLCITYNA